MQRFFLRAACAAALVATAACELLTGSDGAPGELRGTWGGQPFQAVARLRAEGGSLVLYGSSPGADVTEEVVDVTVEGFRGVGSYPLGPGAGRVTHLVGGDGIWAMYETPDQGGTLTVTEMDGAHIAGRVEFQADAGRGATPAGTRARFEATFRGRVSAPRR